MNKSLIVSTLLIVFFLRIPGSHSAEISSDSQPGHVLSLSRVIDSVSTQYPPYLAALIERDINQGAVRGAQGAFDFQTFAKVFSYPTGFYERTSIEAGFEQFTGLWGSTVFGGYRWTDGFLPDYYNNERTHRGGSATLGFKLPILRDGSIDKRRLRLQKARLDLEITNPIIQRQSLDFTRAAAASYLMWLQSGKRLELAERTLNLAKSRQEAIETRISQGLTAKAISLENRQLVLSRTIEIIEAKKDFDTSSVTLSLFLRDQDGNMISATPQSLPEDWPIIGPRPDNLLPSAIKFAQLNRPEIRIYELELQKLGLDREFYQNQWLPRLDAYASANQDLGEEIYKDKGEFEMKLGLEFSIPLQRNEARGAIQANRGKIAQLERKAGFAMDKILTELDSKLIYLKAAQNQVDLSLENFKLADSLREIESDRFLLGATDLLSLQIREQAAFKAEMQLIKSQYSVLLATIDFLIAAGTQLNDSQSPTESLWQFSQRWNEID